MLVKSNKVIKVKEKKLNNVDTIFLNKGVQKYNYELSYNSNREKPILNIENVIISKSVIEKHKNIEIVGTDAKNIYVEDEENLGGLTINSEYLNKKYLFVIPGKTSIKNRLEKINIIYDDNICTINLDEKFSYIRINYYQFKEGFIEIYLSNDLGNIEYLISDKGKVEKIKRKHHITNDDIKNKVLDMRNLIEYDSLYISETDKSLKTADIETIIFNKKVLKNIDKFKNNLYVFDKRWPYLKSKNIRIIEENDMKLLPTDVTYFFKNAITYLHNNNVYLYLENDGNDVLIYTDKNDNLKIIEKNKLLNYESVESVYFKVEESLSYPNSIDTSLVLVKYNDNTYKINIFDKTIDITEDFNRILLINKDYLKLTNNEFEDIKNNDWVKIIDYTNFNNDRINNFYKIYLKYIEALNYLYSLELSKTTIKYLWERNYMKPLLDNIINNKDEIYVKEEIESFKKLAKKYNN